MTVWTNELEITFDIIFGVAIDMINFQRYFIGEGINFVPSTDRACITELMYQVSSYMCRDIFCINTYATTNFVGSPLTNECVILVINLALV